MSTSRKPLIRFGINDFSNNSKFGIGHNCFNLIRSYLEKRRKTVKTKHQLSVELAVPSGFTQGSLLGPVFFLVYMSDLPDIMISANFGYGDDFKFSEDKPVTLNIDVTRSYKWFSGNFMSMNLAKIKYSAIKGCATVPPSLYTFEKAKTMNDLGVLFPESLSWSPHAKIRAETAIKVLHTPERNISKATLVNRKKCMSLTLFQRSSTHRT